METFTANGFTVTIKPDDHPDSPRHLFDNAGTMVCWHRSYNLGDKHHSAHPDDFNDWWAEHGGGGIKLPLFLHDHGGIPGK